MEEVDRRVQEYEQGTNSYLKRPSTLHAFEESQLLVLGTDSINEVNWASRKKIAMKFIGETARREKNIWERKSNFHKS